MSLHHYPAARRYSSPLERPAPRSLLVSPAFWFGGAACIVIWVCVIAAVAAYFGGQHG